MEGFSLINIFHTENNVTAIKFFTSNDADSSCVSAISVIEPVMLCSNFYTFVAVTSNDVYNTSNRISSVQD